MTLKNEDSILSEIGSHLFIHERVYSKYPELTLPKYLKKNLTQKFYTKCIKSFITRTLVLDLNTDEYIVYDNQSKLLGSNKIHWR